MSPSKCSDSCNSQKSKEPSQKSLETSAQGLIIGPREIDNISEIPQKVIEVAHIDLADSIEASAGQIEASVND